MIKLYEKNMTFAATASVAVVADNFAGQDQNWNFPHVVAAICTVWYVFIVAVNAIGSIQL